MNDLWMALTVDTSGVDDQLGVLQDQLIVDISVIGDDDHGILILEHSQASDRRTPGLPDPSKIASVGPPECGGHGS